MLREDPEYAKLSAVKGLTDVTEFRDKYVVGTEEFKAAMLKLADEKKEERALYQAVVDAAKQEKDDAARQLIVAAEKRKKHAFRDVRDDPSRAEQVSSWRCLYGQGAKCTLGDLCQEQRVCYEPHCVSRALKPLLRLSGVTNATILPCPS